MWKIEFGWSPLFYKYFVKIFEEAEDGALVELFKTTYFDEMKEALTYIDIHGERLFWNTKLKEIRQNEA